MSKNRIRLRHRNGFSLVEAMTASMIVTMAGAAMLLAVGESLTTSSSGIDTSRANLMARELMAEISSVRWADPDQPSHWGIEDGESYRNTRVHFDDLDDYDGWVGPPQTKTGTQYDAWQKLRFSNVPSHPYAKYTCRILVTPVSAANEPLQAGQTSSYRRVTVEIQHQDLAPHRLSQTFIDLAPLLGRSHWFDPNCTESPADVEVVP